jgi:hypothetical protein
LPSLATAAAKSIAPNTSIRGAGANDWTKTDSSSLLRSPSGPYLRTPVRPCASIPRASSSTAWSSRFPDPSVPDDRRPWGSVSPVVQITRLAPTCPGPAMTVATATGSSARTAAATSPSSGNNSWLAGSTKTSMMPPQVRPTAKASSSDMPYVCSTGCPLARTSPVSSYTAPSTQPPETLPTTSPSAATAIAAPGSLGALLNVRTTVARPNASPVSHHLEIGSRMSRTIVTSAARDMTSGYVPGAPGGDPRAARTAGGREGGGGHAPGRRAGLTGQRRPGPVAAS